MLKHLMHWGTSFLKQHSMIDWFDQLWVMIPPYSGFAQFNKPYCQLTQWTGQEIQPFWGVIVPVFGRLFEVFRQGKGFASQMRCYASRNHCILAYSTVLVSYCGHDRVHNDVSGGVSSWEERFLLIPRQYIYKGGLGSLENAGYFGQTGGMGEWSRLEQTFCRCTGLPWW